MADTKVSNFTVAASVLPTDILPAVVDPAGTPLSRRAAIGLVRGYDDVNGLRLTGTTALPITSADVASTTSVYLTPYTSGCIALYDGTYWTVSQTAEVSLALGTLVDATNYDVFAYASTPGGAVTLELGAAWTNNTTRSAAITRQNGIWVKSGATTRRLVGTIRTISTTTTCDTKLQRYIWNASNAVPRRLIVAEATATWAYNTPGGTWRQTRATAANKFEYVSGDVHLLRAHAISSAVCSSSVSSAASGIGIDRTNGNDAELYGADVDALTAKQLHSDYVGYQALGYHAINWLESGASGALNFTFVGSGTVTANGMYGEILA